MSLYNYMGWRYIRGISLGYLTMAPQLRGLLHILFITYPSYSSPRLVMLIMGQ